MNRVHQAVIMVGGKGTRLRPLTDNRPKPILPVLDKPCLGYLIDSFIDAGIDEIILACCYRSEQMVASIGDGSDRNVVIRYSYEDRPMGTAGAMKLLEDQLDDVFVAANGDVFADINLNEEIEKHFCTDSAVTLALTSVDNPTEFGIVRQDGDGRILEFKEKPKPKEVFSNQINAGVYVIDRDVLSFIPKGKMFDFSKELIPVLMEKGYRIQGHNISGTWMDVGRPKDLLRANLLSAETRYKGHDWGDAVISDRIVEPFYMGKNSKVESSDIGNSVIMKGVSISDSKIHGSVIMAGCIIEKSTIIDSILGEGVIVADGANISNSVIGDGTVISENAVINEVLQ